MATSTGRTRRRLAGLCLVLTCALGCRKEPTPPPSEGSEETGSSEISVGYRQPKPIEFEAHAKALARLRTAALPALRLIDPVATARLEDAPLRPPGFGSRARAERREAIEVALKEAEGLDAKMLEPKGMVTLWMLELGLKRAKARLSRPPWRDDPRAVLHALDPYFSELDRRIAEGRCDDGCGLGQLGEALTGAFDEVGSATIATTAAARRDLGSRRQWLASAVANLPAEHALRTASDSLNITFDAIDAKLATAEAALPAAEEVAWEVAVAPAGPGAWKRRPARWGATTLREWLEHAESYGGPADDIFPDVVQALARLTAMRDRGRPGEPDAPLPRPFDEAACTSTFETISTWAQEQQSHLQATLDCGALLRRFAAESEKDPAVFLTLVEQGVVEPTRDGVRKSTGIDIALVSGRAGARAQRSLLGVSVTTGLGHHDAAAVAVERAHREVCSAAAAVWIHGALGDDATLAQKLAPYGCGDTPSLIAAVEARPRVALEGLGMLLIGQGPADAAALDRYWWAPLGLVSTLARPPQPQVDLPGEVKIVDLDPNSPTLLPEGKEPVAPNP